MLSSYSKSAAFVASPLLVVSRVEPLFGEARHGESERKAQLHVDLDLEYRLDFRG